MQSSSVTRSGASHPPVPVNALTCERSRNDLTLPRVAHAGRVLAVARGAPVVVRRQANARVLLETVTDGDLNGRVARSPSQSRHRAALAPPYPRTPTTSPAQGATCLPVAGYEDVPGTDYSGVD